MDIAVVDYQGQARAERFVRSMSHTGFCVLKNHPIDESLIEEAFSEWNRFFKQSEVNKRQYLFQRDFKIVQGGFFPQEVSETAKGFSAKDMKEFFHYYPCSGEPPYRNRERDGDSQERTHHHGERPSCLARRVFTGGHTRWPLDSAHQHGRR